MNMMNIYNSFYLHEFMFYFFNVDFSRYSIEIHTNTFLENAYNTIYHHKRNNYRDDRIDNSISCKIDNSTPYNNTKRDECISEKMHIGRFDIDILFTSSHQKPSRNTIDEYSYSRNYHHSSSNSFYRFHHAVECLIYEKECGDNQKDGIEKCSEYTCSLISIGITRGILFHREP